MNKLRYGCVGAGAIADKKHIMEYSAMENVELVAICDTNAKAAGFLAEKYKMPKVYKDYNEMFAKANKNN